MTALPTTRIPAPGAGAPLAAFVEAARAALVDGTFESLVLSKPRAPSGAPKAVRIRSIALKGKPMYSLIATWRCSEWSQAR